jgi:hypothetical protein
VKLSDKPSDSHPLPSGRDRLELSSVERWREFVKFLKLQWKQMWRERIDDKFLAEGIANKDYSLLFVDQGTIIIATRDYKPLSFKEIVESYKVPYMEKVIQPHPSVGGWGKFIRTVIRNQKIQKQNRRQQAFKHKREKQQLKKGGRGWLHLDL